MWKLPLVFLIFVSPLVSAWTSRASVTFPAASGSSTLTDWTGLFTGSDTKLKTVSNGGQVQNTVTRLTILVPADFALTTDPTCSTITGYNWDIEFYDPTAGTIKGWVKMTLTTGSTVVPVVCIGNAAVTTWQGGTQGSAYDSNTMTVYHLPDGATLNLFDFSASGIALGNFGAVTAGAGQIDGGAVFSGGANAFLQRGSTINVFDITVECWAKPASTSLGMLVENDPVNTKWMLFWDGSHFVWRGNQGSLGSGSSSLSFGTWYHVAGVGTASGAGAGVFVNGIIGTGLITPPDVGSTATNVGAWGASPGSDRFNGSIDNIVISSIGRSVDWITNDYMNELSPPAISFFVPISGTRRRLLN